MIPSSGSAPALPTLRRLRYWSRVIVLSCIVGVFLTELAVAAPALSALNVTGLSGLSPAFSPAVTSYTLKAAPEAGNLPLTATLADPAGHLAINSNQSTSGATVNASTWGDKIKIQAISANWAETTTYTITIVRVTPPRLESLALAGFTLTPAFAPSTTSYAITVPTSTGNIPLTAVLAAPKGFLSINSNMSTDGATVNASTWGDKIKVQAISANWQLTNTYTITVIRSNAAPAPSPTPTPPAPPPATPTYALTVVGGSGSGSYSAGTAVPLTAAAAPAGQQFAGWTGAPVANSAAASTTLTMPAAATTVTATFAPIVTDFTLTVVNGTGSGTYQAGAAVAIAAAAAPDGQAFSHWSTTHGATVAHANAPATTLTMPAAHATVTAVYQALLPAGTVAPAAPTNPILFVTQIPVGTDFTTIGSTFGNHRPNTNSTGRGGDLYIRYPDGSLRNLTAAAGYGVASGFQGATSIAVRDPAVHWGAQKAVFSMVVGAPATQFADSAARWQLYEITGFGAGETPVIAKVPHQPAAYNNVSPLYGSDGRILFTSDRPRDGQSHLYPQLDEYELAPTVTGLWSLDPATGHLFNLNHTPSGAFTPTIDSFGRVLFTRWDHLQQDQQADIDRANLASGTPLNYGVFNYANESASAPALFGDRTEVFPELRNPVGHVAGHRFNLFFPWMIHEDGTEEETLNHIGRQELAGFASRSFTDDPNVVDFSVGGRLNQTMIENFFHLKEDPTQPGRYYGVDAPEFTTHSAGLIVSLLAPPGLPADQIPLTYESYPLGRFGYPAPPANPGRFREPLPLANGTLLAIHTDTTAAETKTGIGSDYAFRLKTLVKSGAYWRAHQPLTSGLWKSVSFYSNGALVNYSGPLWELNPVEVRARSIPYAAKTPLGQPEQDVFAEEGVNLPAFQADLAAKGLALVVSRDVTTRDRADRQQPYNLRVAGTDTQTVGSGGLLYDVAHLQFFQGDQIRGVGMRTPASTPMPGRRVLAQALHDPAAVAANVPNPAGPAGSVQLGADGSMAAFLPARRATTWQLTDPAGTPTVRERYWVTFQPGEIRTCASCHGANSQDQAGQLAPTNKPEALRTLLQYWKAQNAPAAP